MGLLERKEVEEGKLQELEERLIFLQKNAEDNEEKEKTALEQEQEAERQLRSKQEVIQLVTDDHHALSLRRDLMQAGDRSKRRRAKNVGSQSSPRTGSRTAFPGNASSSSLPKPTDEPGMNSSAQPSVVRAVVPELQDAVEQPGEGSRADNGESAQ